MPHQAPFGPQQPQRQGQGLEVLGGRSNGGHEPSCQAFGMGNRRPGQQSHLQGHRDSLTSLWQRTSSSTLIAARLLHSYTEGHLLAQQWSHFDTPGGLAIRDADGNIISLTDASMLKVVGGGSWTAPKSPQGRFRHGELSVESLPHGFCWRRLRDLISFPLSGCQSVSGPVCAAPAVGVLLGVQI